MHYYFYDYNSIIINFDYNNAFDRNAMFYRDIFIWQIKNQIVIGNLTQNKK
jgi:hypothetical protein